jgi:7-carboxy-7-deazaguanine synthase
LLIDEMTLSPKPPSSTMVTDWGILDNMVEKLSRNGSNFSLKIVIFDEQDLEYAGRVHERYPHAPLYLQTGNDDLKEVDATILLSRLLRKYEWLIDKVTDSTKLKSVRVLPQLHTWIWGNKRGV